jgi:hypothetical protein
MSDPLHRVWSGPHFEVLLLKNAISRSHLCHKCKESVKSVLDAKLAELDLTAQLSGMSLGPSSPALQGATYWHAVVDRDQSSPKKDPTSEDLRLICSKEGRKIAVDAETVLYALKQTGGYEEMKERWAVGDIKYKVLFALEGAMERVDLADAYRTFPPPTTQYRARSEQGLFGRFTQMHWERYSEFEAKIYRLQDAIGTYVYPCQCWDLVFAHETIVGWYRAAEASHPELLSREVSRAATEVVWAMHHVLIRVTGSIDSWSPPGSVESWMNYVYEEDIVFENGVEGVGAVVPISLAILKNNLFDVWLTKQARDVEAQIALMGRMVGHARSRAASFEAELVEMQICPSMSGLQLTPMEE